MNLDAASEDCYNGENQKITGETNMKVTQVVFSPTGGTQQVTDTITSTWENYVNKVDLTDLENEYFALNFSEDDIAVVAVPSYGGRVPALAAERLAKINGSHAQCVIVCVNTDMAGLQIPGNRPYKKAGGGGLVPKANDKCVSCGLCAEKCPAQAARKVNGAMVSTLALALKKACSERKDNELYI